MPKPVHIDNGMAELLREALDLESFYAVLTAETVVRIFPQSGAFTYDLGEYVVRQGEKSRDLYVIQTGAVSITQTMGSAAVQLATLGPGELFGEIALLSDGVRVASAVAAEPSRIFRLNQLDIRRAMESNPELGRHLVELARRRRG